MLDYGIEALLVYCDPNDFDDDRVDDYDDVYCEDKDESLNVQVRGPEDKNDLYVPLRDQSKRKGGEEISNIFIIRK